MGPAFAAFVASFKRGETRGGGPLRVAALLLASLALFVLLVPARASGWTVPGLIVVILLHEAGHYLGMVGFGYRRVRLVFIPLFGGAATGSKHAAPAWQEATISLLGPLPGLALAAALGFTLPKEITIRASEALPWPDGLLIELAGLLLLNALNLLPIYPLDGGRLVQLLLFAHAPRVWLAFLSVSLLALVGLGVASRTWLLVGAGLLGLGALPLSIREHRLAMAVRRRVRGLSASLEDLTDRECRLLFRLARLYDPTEEDPGELAEHARALHEQLVKPALTRRGAAVVVVAYAVGWALAFVASSRMPVIRVLG